LGIQFEQLGDLDLLAEAIELQRQALDLRTPGHPDRSTSLHNLANAVRTRFEQYGDLESLAEAVELHRQALVLRPQGDPDRASSLSNLANALLTRSQQLDDMDSLAEAIELHRQTLTLCPTGHSHRPSSLHNLATALQTRFEQLRDLSSLEEAIELHRQALNLRPAGHPDRSSSLNNLANAVRNRFEALGDLDHLSEAVELHRQALDLRRPGHPDRSWSLRNLANALRTRFEQLHQAVDLDEAMSLYKEGLHSGADEHPTRIDFLFSISRCLLQTETQVFDFEKGLRYILEALRNQSVPARQSLTHAVDALRLVEVAYSFSTDHTNSVELGRHHHDGLVLQIYTLVLRLLPRAASFGLDHASRLDELSGADAISRDGATRAIAAGRETEAVEMLEEGRGVFWLQALRLRARDLDLLSVQDSQKLQRLLQALENGGVRDETMTTVQRERHVEDQRRLSNAAEALIAHALV
jgi:tetratricopeptide (TPR) repeat protein